MSTFAVGETEHGKVYLLTGERCVVTVRIGRRRGSVDKRLRRRRRRPFLVGRGVRVMRRVMRRMVAEAACTTQQKATVTRRCCHIVVMVFVHGPRKRKESIGKFITRRK